MFPAVLDDIIAEFIPNCAHPDHSQELAHLAQPVVGNIAIQHIKGIQMLPSIAPLYGCDDPGVHRLHFRGGRNLTSTFVTSGSASIFPWASSRLLEKMTFFVLVFFQYTRRICAAKGNASPVFVQAVPTIIKSEFLTGLLSKRTLTFRVSDHH